VTRADRLRQRAREVEDDAESIRFTNPTEYRRFKAIAIDLRDIADHLPPERSAP
jgi:hypothetical protein